MEGSSGYGESNVCNYSNTFQNSSSYNHSNKPYDNKFNSPYDNKFNSPYDNRFNSPYDNKFNSPYDNKFNSPYDNKLNSPYDNKFNSPYDNHSNKPYDNKLNSPYDNKLNNLYNYSINSHNDYNQLENNNVLQNNNLKTSNNLYNDHNNIIYNSKLNNNNLYNDYDNKSNNNQYSNNLYDNRLNIFRINDKNIMESTLEDIFTAEFLMLLEMDTFKAVSILDMLDKIAHASLIIRTYTLAGLPAPYFNVLLEHYIANRYILRKDEASALVEYFLFHSMEEELGMLDRIYPTSRLYKIFHANIIRGYETRGSLREIKKLISKYRKHCVVDEEQLAALVPISDDFVKLSKSILTAKSSQNMHTVNAFNDHNDNTISIGNNKNSKYNTSVRIDDNTIDGVGHVNSKNNMDVRSNEDNRNNMDVRSNEDNRNNMDVRSNEDNRNNMDVRSNEDNRNNMCVRSNENNRNNMDVRSNEDNRNNMDVRSNEDNRNNSKSNEDSKNITSIIVTNKSVNAVNTGKIDQKSKESGENDLINERVTGNICFNSYNGHGDISLLDETNSSSKDGGFLDVENSFIISDGNNDPQDDWLTVPSVYNNSDSTFAMSGISESSSNSTEVQDNSKNFPLEKHLGNISITGTPARKKRDTTVGIKTIKYQGDKYIGSHCATNTDNNSNINNANDNSNINDNVTNSNYKFKGENILINGNNINNGSENIYKINKDNKNNSNNDNSTNSIYKTNNDNIHSNINRNFVKDNSIDNNNSQTISKFNANTSISNNNSINSDVITIDSHVNRKKRDLNTIDKLLSKIIHPDPVIAYASISQLNTMIASDINAFIFSANTILSSLIIQLFDSFDSSQMRNAVLSTIFRLSQSTRFCAALRYETLRSVNLDLIRIAPQNSVAADILINLCLNCSVEILRVYYDILNASAVNYSNDFIMKLIWRHSKKADDIPARDVQQIIKIINDFYHKENNLLATAENVIVKVCLLHIKSFCMNYSDGIYKFDLADRTVKIVNLLLSRKELNLNTVRDIFKKG